MVLRNDSQNKGTNNLCKKFQEFLKLSPYKSFSGLREGRD